MNLRPTTLLAQAGTRRDTLTGALSVPIYQTASFSHPALGQSTGFDYSRTGNPTRLALEETLAAVEGGDKAFAFASGLAAIDAVMHLFKAGDTLLVTEDLYGGTYRMFEQIYAPLGIRVAYVDTADTAATLHQINTSGAKALFIESPTNPLLKIADIVTLATQARAKGLLTIVDNTFLTPVLQTPLSLGADLVVYSATKYLAGHNDVVAGIVVARTPELSARIGFIQNAVGAILGPQDSWLTLRGLKTLPLRLARQQENALALARWLATHPRVRLVRYPGLPTHAGHALLLRQSRGFGSMLAFEVEEPARIPAILSGVKVFLFAESLGGVESLITYPSVQTHADIHPETRQRLGINERLLRLSVGIEEIADLIGDLEAVL